MFASEILRKFLERGKRAPEPWPGRRPGQEDGKKAAADGLREQGKSEAQLGRSQMALESITRDRKFMDVDQMGQECQGPN